MVTASAVVGLAYLTTGTALLFLLREPLRHSSKPGSMGFAMAMLGTSLWPLSLGVNYFVADLGISVGLWNLRLFAASIISVGWFLLAVTLTTGKRPSKRLRALLATYLVVGLLVTWTNPWHQLVLESGTALEGTRLVPVDGSWFWVQAAVNYGLIVGSTALLASESLRSTGIRRKQAALMAVAVVPPLAVNVLTNFGVIGTPHDLTPFGLIGSGLLLSWVLYRVGFLDVVPIAREIAMADMRDAVVTLDSEDRVIDCNEAAKRLFDPAADYVELSIDEFFEGVSEETRERFASPEEGDTEFSTVIDGEERHFSLTASSVTDGEQAVGRVLVIHDVTGIRRREQALENREAELDLLGQVLSRILRHNIRNDLVTIQGNAADIRDQSADEFARTRSQEILDASNSLLDTSEKARAVERIVDSGDDRTLVDLREVATAVTEEHRDAYPAVSFEVRGPRGCRVRTNPWFEKAVASLVENAAKHNDADEPRVTVLVERTGTGSRISVVDNGPGIPKHELEALRRDEETPLAHGSGLGLWLVKWTTNASSARLDFETSDDGTVATVTFDETTASDENAAFEEAERFDEATGFDDPESFDERVETTR